MNIILRIDDVGRQPTDTPENGTDNHLFYFFRWREALGLKGLPVYYGVVPTWISREALDRLEIELTGEERLAIHGWDHVRSRCPGVVQMKEAIRYFEALKPSTYIPPYNEYDASTLKNWKVAGGEHFFGGFPQEHFPGTGQFPSVIHDLFYLPAYKPYYGHGWKIAKALSEDCTIKYPLVMTLHVPWDTESTWSVLRGVIDSVKSRLISLSDTSLGVYCGR